MNLEYLLSIYSKAFPDFDEDKEKEIAHKYLNIGYADVYESHFWEYRKRTGNLLLLPNYVNGSCSVTKFDGTNEATARAVTGSGATFTQSMVGRYFKPSGSSTWHKIIYISGSTLYLDTPIVDVSSGSYSYEIWKRFSYVKSDVDVLYDFDKWSDDRLGYISDTGLTDRVADTGATGTPYLFSPFGIDQYDDVEYSTGSIEVSADSNVVTGTGTAWLSSGADTGDIMEINSVDYYVKRVESDTRIIIFNYIEEAIGAGKTYSIRKNNPLGFQFYYSTDEYKVIPYTYLARATELIHSTKDLIQLPRRFISAIVSRAVYFHMRDVKDSRYGDMLSIYQAELEGLKKKVRIVNPRSMQFAPKIERSMPGRY